MAEMDWTLPTELDRTLSEFYTAPQPDPEFAVHLERKLTSRQSELLQIPAIPRSSWQTKNSSLTHALRTRPSILLLVILLALLLLFGVAYSVARLSGYLPGFGFVTDAGKTLVLSQPVEVTQGGILLQVDKMVSNQSLFWVELTVVGSPDGQDFSKAFVLLQSGEKIASLAGMETSSTEGVEHRTYSFPPLGKTPNHLTLLIDNLGGQDFSLPLDLRPLQPGEILPVQPAGAAPQQSGMSDGVALVLDQIAYASDKTILQVSLHFERPNTWVAGRWQVQLTGQDGSLYPLVDVSPDIPATAEDTTRIYQTVPFAGTEQLTLTLKMFPLGEDLPLFVDYSPEGIGFSFDPGTDPQVGQTWELDKTLKLDDFTVHLVGARLISGPGLSFEFEPGKNVTGLMLFTPDPALHGSTSALPLQNGNITAGLTFDTIPAKPLEVRVVRVYYTAHGPWQIHWQPQTAPPTKGKPTPIPTAGPTLAPYSTSTPASSDPILLEMQALIQKFDAPLQQGPGWIHIQNETTSRVSPGQAFPPAYVRTDQWFEVDAGGYVVWSVHLDRDADGQIIQQAASVGNYSVNFTSGDAGFNDAHPYHVSTDELIQYLNQPAQPNATVTRRESPCEDGRPCIVITMQESFPQPMPNPGEDQPFWGAGRRVWVDTQTGQQVKVQSFWLLEDGSELINFTKQTLVVEKVASPPQAILDILEKVVVP